MLPLYKWPGCGIMGIAELPLTISSTWNHFFLHESSLSSPRFFEQGKDCVEFCLPSLTIPSTRNHLFLVYGAKIMSGIAGLPLAIPSIRIHLSLSLLHQVFNRDIGLFGVAGLLLTIPSHRNHLCLLNDSLNKARSPVSLWLTIHQESSHPPLWCLQNSHNHWLFHPPGIFSFSSMTCLTGSGWFRVMLGFFWTFHPQQIT